METFQMILSSLTAVVALGGGPWLWREIKKMKAAEVRQLETNTAVIANDEWRKIADEWKERCQEKDRKIDELYKAIEQGRVENAALLQKNAQLQVDHIKSLLKLCERPACKDRQPQTGY